MINWTVCQNDRQANKEISPFTREILNYKEIVSKICDGPSCTQYVWEVGEKDEKAALIDDVFLLSWVE